MNKKVIIIVCVIIVLLILSVLPIVDKTSPSEPVIIDHSKLEISHPSCFETANFTNYIDEVSYDYAVNELGYNVVDECSIERLPSGKESILQKILN